MSASRIALLFSALVLTMSVSAQPAKKSDDPQNKPRKERRESKKAFEDFIREVEAIITPDELDAWKKLKTDEEREQFIAIIWRKRDPDPDTEENEYREAYYERLAYVNEHFASGKPGYKTDRGKIYLKYGKPDEVESHPTGGPYQRAHHEGGGIATTYPFEKWWYRHIPGRSDVELEFVDPSGTGEYRLARNPFEKEASLYIPGGSPTLDGVSQADRVAAANGFGNPFSTRAKDSQFEWLDLMRIRDEAPPVDFDRTIGTGTDTPRLEENFLDSEIKVSFFRQSDDRVIVAFTVQADNRDLTFRDVGGLPTARLNIAGRIVTVTNRRVGYFEDVVTTTATTAELVDAKGRQSAYQKALPMLPGRYRIDLLVRDIESGAAGIHHLGFEVPKFGSDLAVSSLVLASVLEHVSDVPASRQFVIGDKKVIPNLTATYRRGSPIGVYLQIYNAAIDQTTLRPSVDVEYVLLKDGKEIGKQTEDWRGNSDSGARLTVARLIDSRDLTPGEYAIEIRIRDRVNEQKLTETAKFKIAQ